MIEPVHSNGKWGSVIDHLFRCDCDGCKRKKLNGSAVPRFPKGWMRVHLEGEDGDTCIQVRADLCDDHAAKIIEMLGSRPKGRGWTLLASGKQIGAPTVAQQEGRLPDAD